jgi:hypothetical protein
MNTNEHEYFSAVIRVHSCSFVAEKKSAERRRSPDAGDAGGDLKKRTERMEPRMNTNFSPRLSVFIRVHSWLKKRAPREGRSPDVGDAGGCLGSQP